MKELSIEEKAKAYDEALERAKNFIENGDERERTIAESIFAGIMEETEDEKIKKEIIDIINSYDVAHLKAAGLPSRIPEYITWLEKQGEQKPVNRLKTTAGNWYVCDMEVMNENMTTAFHRGEVYYCPKDGYIDVNGALFEVGTLDVFRLATKEEIPQQKHEWSEADEEKMNWIIATLNNCSMRNSESLPMNESCEDWLKSLRPQPRWKPSKEQMYYLKKNIDSLDTISIRPSRQNLESLYNDLKKL